MKTTLNDGTHIKITKEELKQLHAQYNNAIFYSGISTAILAFVAHYIIQEIIPTSFTITLEFLNKPIDANTLTLIATSAIILISFSTLLFKFRSDAYNNLLKRRLPNESNT